jgi:hypothetical protein
MQAWLDLSTNIYHGDAIDALLVLGKIEKTK